GYRNTQINAYNCNQILGAGTRWDLNNIAAIPRGWIWNTQGISSSVCHWGVSLGNGRAAGTNNTEAEGKGSGRRAVAFELDGGMKYGRFTLASQVEVLKIKYDAATVRIESPIESGGKIEVERTGIETKLFVMDPTQIAFQNDY